MGIDLSESRSLRSFEVGDQVLVRDKMQKGYRYKLVRPFGKDFDAEFNPDLSPSEMLKLGVFEGKYLNDCVKEFPKEWYEKAMKKLSPEKADASINYFGIKSRQPLSVWRKKQWIMPGDPDVRGWFQWYCRYYIGRRDEILDRRQIKRWKAFRRHAAQIKKNCVPADTTCRPKQRQALLQWAYDPFI